MQENDYTVLLSDEEGNEIECELLDRVVFSGETFCVLLPVDDDSSEPEAIILRENENGELVGLEDGAVLDAVFALFLEQNGMTE